MTRVRLMTFNILMGGRRGAALHEVIREVAPDVRLVNENPELPLGEVGLRADAETTGSNRDAAWPPPSSGSTAGCSASSPAT